jgi:hypothetical protein
MDSERAAWQFLEELHDDPGVHPAAGRSNSYSNRSQNGGASALARRKKTPLAGLCDYGVD